MTATAPTWREVKQAHPEIARKYTYMCGISHCGADDMSRREYHEHMAFSHNHVIRKALPLARVIR